MRQLFFTFSVLAFLSACASSSDTSSESRQPDSLITDTTSAYRTGDTVGNDASATAGEPTPIDVLPINADTINRMTDVKTEVPASITSAFQAKYPDVTVRLWKKGNNVYGTSFQREGKTRYATFSADGAWLQSFYETTANELPASVKQAFQRSRYNSVTTAKYCVVEAPDYEMLYQVQGDWNGERVTVFFTPEGEVNVPFEENRE